MYSKTPGSKTCTPANISGVSGVGDRRRLHRGSGGCDTARRSRSRRSAPLADRGAAPWWPVRRAARCQAMTSRRSTSMMMSALSTTKRIAGRNGCALLDRAAGVEDGIFRRVGDRHAVARCRRRARRGSASPQMVQVDDDLADAGGAQQCERIGDQRLAGDLEQRLRHAIGQRTQPGAEAGGEDHRSHDRSSGSVLRQDALHRREIGARARAGGAIWRQVGGR